MDALTDQCEEGGAIAREFRRADAVDAPEFIEARRFRRRHLDQTAVGEDDIGRLFLRLGERAAQRFQRAFLCAPQQGQQPGPVRFRHP